MDSIITHALFSMPDDSDINRMMCSSEKQPLKQYLDAYLNTENKKPCSLKYWTPLAVAVYLNDEAAVQVLSEKILFSFEKTSDTSYYSDWNHLLSDRYERTPWHYLAWSGNLPILQEAINKGFCNPDAKNKDGTTLWHFLAWSGNFPALKTFIQKGLCNPSVKNQYGATLWHYLAWSGNLSELQKSIKISLCDPTVNNYSGATLWHYLARSGNLPILQEAIFRGLCDPEIKNNLNETVWDSVPNAQSDLSKKAWEAVNRLLCAELNDEIMADLLNCPTFSLPLLANMLKKSNHGISASILQAVIPKIIKRQLLNCHKESHFIEILIANSAILDTYILPLPREILLQLLRDTPDYAISFKQKLCLQVQASAEDRYDSYIELLPHLSFILHHEAKNKNEQESFLRFWPAWLVNPLIQIQSVEPLDKIKSIIFQEKINSQIIEFDLISSFNKGLSFQKTITQEISEEKDNGASLKFKK